MTVSGGDKTGYGNNLPKIAFLNGATLQFLARDTFSRELVLSNGSHVVVNSHDTGRGLDLFGNAKLSVYGAGTTSTIGGTTPGTTAGSGVISLRRDNLEMWVEQGATLDVWSQWGYNSESTSLGRTVYKTGLGTVAFHRATPQKGAFTVAAGTLKLVDAGAPTTGAITLADGAALVCETTAGVTQNLSNVTLNGASLMISGAGVTRLPGNVDGCVLDGATIDLNGHDLRNLTGSGSVVDSVGTGKLVLGDGGLPNVRMSCRVQFTDGSVLRAPFDSISVNVKGGNDNIAARAIASDRVAGVVPMPGAQWSQVITRTGPAAVGGRLDTGDVVYEVLADGSRVESGMTVKPYAACCYSAQGRSTPVSGNGELMFGYLDDGEKNVPGKGASIDLANIPYTEYTLYVYVGTDADNKANRQFGPVYVNGTAYPADAAWGSADTTHENGAALQLVEGRNFIRVAGLTGSTLSIVGSRSNTPSAGTRCGIAGFQIVNTGLRRTFGTVFCIH